MAKKHGVDYELVTKIFEVERGHLRLGKEEERIRIDELIQTVS